MMHWVAALDASVLHALAAARTASASYFFIDISELASPLTAAGLGLCIALGLLLRRNFSALAGFAVALGGSNAAWFLIKEFVQRPRPALSNAAYLETGSSFPSGHAANISALCLFVLMLAWPHIPRGLPRIAACALSVALVFLISFARLYLGVHYLSDVVAGLFLGSVFAVAGVYAARVTTRSMSKRGWR